jgi:hypothetical protein
VKSFFNDWLDFLDKLNQTGDFFFVLSKKILVFYDDILKSSDFLFIFVFVLYDLF